MKVAVPVVLCVLALLDGCFSGFRAAAGRDGRIDKRAYARAACAQGTRWGLAVIVALAVCSLAALADEPGRYTEFVRAGTRMLLVLVPYAVLVLGALLGYISLRRTSLQTLMTTLILGPFTLMRPLIVVAAVLLGLTVQDSAVRAVTVLSGVLVLAVEPLMRRRPPPDVPVTTPPWLRAGDRSAAAPHMSGGEGDR